jgi:hypothetical protein
MAARGAETSFMVERPVQKGNFIRYLQWLGCREPGVLKFVNRRVTLLEVALGRALMALDHFMINKQKTELIWLDLSLLCILSSD